MAVVEQLIRSESDGSISFGNHTLDAKQKKEDFPHAGDLYKVKTFSTMTKLEKNGAFLYESVPGTSVNNMVETAKGVTFTVEGAEDAQIILGLKDDTEYEIKVNGNSAGKQSTGLGGKLSVSVELADMGEVSVEVTEV
ncbi:MAG: endosialidase [Lachnospiraceae bacterium]|nr:endosialidase [Lachnospiraceae bacterium]